jgi:hypothetical protein
MLTTLEQAERLLAVAKRLRDEHRKFARIKAAYPHDGTPKAKQKNAVDLNWQARHIVQIEAELHAVAVDAGVADLRGPEHYAERVHNVDCWPQYKFQPAHPAALAVVEQSLTTEGNHT